jgi:hypothetical protein
MDERVEFVARRLAGEPMAELRRRSRKDGRPSTPNHCRHAMLTGRASGERSRTVENS